MLLDDFSKNAKGEDKANWNISPNFLPYLKKYIIKKAWLFPPSSPPSSPSFDILPPSFPISSTAHPPKPYSPLLWTSAEIAIKTNPSSSTSLNVNARSKHCIVRSAYCASTLPCTLLKHAANSVVIPYVRSVASLFFYGNVRTSTYFLSSPLSPMWSVYCESSSSPFSPLLLLSFPLLLYFLFF